MNTLNAHFTANFKGQQFNFFLFSESDGKKGVTANIPQDDLDRLMADGKINPDYGETSALWMFQSMLIQLMKGELSEGVSNRIWHNHARELFRKMQLEGLLIADPSFPLI
ncbi:MAG: hypothetical protein GY793_07350 [Proteobacteria bacterium]|nr:hypothetical protein [Pseudomonadota bacterium]